MITAMIRAIVIAMLISFVVGGARVVAQTMPADDMAGMDMSPSHDMHGMAHTVHGHESGTSQRGMTGMLGPYPMTRESSGTSWQPESTPMEGLHLMRGDWMFMVHGFADLIYDY